MAGDFDHLVYAAPDAAAEASRLAAALGVAPAVGGRHSGFGTRNFLLGLGGARYLEIVGPDPEAAAPLGPRPFGIDELSAARLVTWAVPSDDLEDAVRRAAQADIELGTPIEMSRATPEGKTLRWRLTKATTQQPYDGLVPFLIDWGSTTHPTAGGLPVVELIRFSARHPDPEGVRRALGVLGVELEVHSGPASLTAVLRGPAGEVTLT